MIRIENLHVHYQTDQGHVHAVRGISLEVKLGQFYTLLGPSGCGKTTTLRSVAGLETPDEGEIFVFPLRERKRKLAQHELRKKVDEALTLVQLEGLSDRPAPFLSGGQQQRLALARALVKEPRVLLLDEPLSNLDAKLREETRLELRELVKRLGITTLYVTHDQLEALTMSDVVTVMDQGRIAQSGTPMEIYQAPQERFVANFIGLTNFLEGRALTEQNEETRLGEIETASGKMRCVLPDGTAPGDHVVLVVRPEDIHVVSETCAEQENASATIQYGEIVCLQLPPERCRALRAS